MTTPYDNAPAGSAKPRFDVTRFRPTGAQLKQAAVLLPLARRLPKNPAFLGLAAVGILGAIAWRNRARIAEAAAPMITQARIRGSALRDRVDAARTREDPASGL